MSSKRVDPETSLIRDVFDLIDDEIKRVLAMHRS